MAEHSEKPRSLTRRNFLKTTGAAAAAGIALGGVSLRTRDASAAGDALPRSGMTRPTSSSSAAASQAFPPPSRPGTEEPMSW